MQDITKHQPKQIVEVDVSNSALGRAATTISTILRGKHLATFDPARVPRISVRVKNVKQIKLPKRAESRIFYWHTGYPGGLRQISLSERFKTDPENVVRHAIQGMLPKNRLRKQMMKNLIFLRESPDAHKT